jgi:multidrug resistance efflux pump
VAAVGAVVAVVMAARSGTTSRVDLVTHKVKLGRLELTVVERGALESADNRDVYCRVKSGAKNSTVATTIKTVIDDGSRVKKDDLLVELDDSGLIEQLKAQKITMDKAESDKIQAEEQYKIQVSQNESDIATATVNLALAKIDLQKYLEGDFPQSLKDVNGRIKTAESDLEQQRDRAAWAQRMVKKGYQTVSQAQAEQSKQESLEISLAKVMEEKRVLIDPEYGLKKRSETDYRNKVAEAERALGRVKSQAASNEVKFRKDRDAKTSVYEQEAAHFHDIEDEIKKCKIYSPQEGMVVYFVPEQARFGGGSQQSIVAQGEPVREGQKLMQIPDLHHMLVNTKVHEAMVSRVHNGQPAVVRIDAYPDKVYPAHIDSVATISSQQDFWAPDVKVYTTKVALDGAVEGLKPGMSAEVKITVGDTLDSIVIVPIEAIVGSAELGSHRRCFVVTPGGPVERDVVVGMSNERVAEIREGLKEGEEVVLNPKAIVGDKMKTHQPGSGPTGDDRSPGEGKGRGGMRGKRPEGAPGGGPEGYPGKAGPQGGGPGGERMKSEIKQDPSRKSATGEHAPGADPKSEHSRAKPREEPKSGGAAMP